ncbi:MAG: LysE family transporter [Candidatus Izemoplasmatales bacterium]
MMGFITYILISVFTPGPNNIFSSISSARLGFKKTHRFMLGILVGTFLVFVIAGLLNVYFYQNVRIITRIIGVTGGIFILYLALKMFLTRNDGEKLLITNDKLFTMAIILNFINAKTIIFGLTVATFYLELGFNPDYMIYFNIFMAILCYLAVIVWGLFGQVFKEYLVKYRTIYNILMSLLLAYSAVIIIVESIS